MTDTNTPAPESSSTSPSEGLISSKKFLERLFPDLDGEYLEMRVIKGKRVVAQKFFSSVDDLTSMIPAFNIFSGGEIYFGVCPRREKKGTKESVSRIGSLWLDLDAKNPAAKEDALKRLREFPLPPTIIVDSGNGYHAYWVLKEPETDKDLIERHLGSLATALGADKSGCEVARVLRIPGTLNQKDPANPLKVQVVSMDETPNYNLSDFDFILRADTVDGGQSLDSKKPKDWIVDALSSLHDGNRNVKFSRIIGRLIHDRHSPDEIYALLLPHAEKCLFEAGELRHEIEKMFKSYAEPTLISHNSLISLPDAQNKWPDPLKDAAYYGLAGEIVRAIEPHSESDPAALLIQFLVFFGNIIRRNAYFAAEADRHFMNFFTVLVGKSSKGRKGTSLRQSKRPFESIDEVWAANCFQSGLSSGEGLIWAVRDSVERREPIKVKGRVVDYEMVEVDPGISDKRLLVTEEEFAQALRSIGREGNTLSAIIRQAWDSGTIRALTKNQPAKATNAHVSIIGHITKDELSRYLDRTEVANGFGNRFLWICVQRSKMLPDGGRIQQVDFGPMVRKLDDTVRLASTASEIIRDDSANELWFEVYPELSKDAPGLIGALIARSEAQVMRLACIYALLDQSLAIRREHLLAALAVWEYSEASVRYIFGDRLGDPVCDTILAALRTNPDGLNRTEISGLFKRHAESSQIDRALRTLLDHGFANPKVVSTRGRPQEIWSASAK